MLQRMMSMTIWKGTLSRGNMLGLGSGVLMIRTTNSIESNGQNKNTCRRVPCG